MSDRYDCSDPEQRAAGLKAAVEAVRRGELIVLPTDTVYGIGAEAFSPAAITALLAAKQRGRDMPPPVLVGTVRAATALVEDLSEVGRGPDRRVLAGRAHAGVPGPAHAELGSGRYQGHGGDPDAVAPGGS